MSHGEPALADLQQLRLTVQARLSLQYWIALVATVVAAPVPLLSAVFCRHFPSWTILFPLLSGAVSILLWILNPWRSPRVRCPKCGEAWEHVEFLGWSQCEQCGLPLPVSAT